MAETYVPVARQADVPAGRVVPCEVGEHEIALCNVDGHIYALENVCTHDDGVLTGGELDGVAIVCPRHGARFDVRTGEVLRMPAAHPLHTYAAKVEGDTIYVKVDVDE